MMASLTEKKKRLGDLLIQDGLLTQTQLDRAVEVQRAKGGRLGDILVELKLMTEADILSATAKRAGIPFVSSLSVYGEIPADVLALLPADMARRRGLLPLARDGRWLTVALADPFAEVDAEDDLKIQTGFDIKIVLATEKEIQRAVEAHYPLAEPPAVPPGNAADSQPAGILNALIENAVKVGATHIFLEPGPLSARVRYRVRGTLERKSDLPSARHGPLVARIKATARMDVAERWVPQDGRFRGEWAGRSIEVKVSTLPTSDGEKAVLSLFDSSWALPLDLGLLGLESEWRGPFQKAMAARRGLLLVAGPAGAGKTATVYAALAGVNVDEKHVLTIEDPIERHIEGITQMQAGADRRLTLASGAHVLRRQAPDVLMLTEIRDVETAEAAVDAAGDCVVLSTVAAGDAVGALSKLIEMGVPPTLLAERLAGVLAQRLVRKICPRCREPHTLTLRELMAAGLGDQEIRGAKRAASFTVYRGRGCGQCLATGYNGSFAIFEGLFPTESVRRLIAERAGPALLYRETAERTTLREAAVNRVLAGETTVEEALRIR